VNSTAHNAQVTGATDRVTISFEDYRRFGKLSLPDRIVSRSEQNGTWSVRVRSIETRANLPAAVFSPPARPTADFRLAHLTRVPISMDTRSPVLDVRINGATLHFLFDTGGQNVITFEAAKRIGLKVVGRGIVGGGGGGTASIAFAQVRTMQIGDALLFNQPFIVLPADSLPPVDGIVGYELLARLKPYADTNLLAWPKPVSA